MEVLSSPWVAAQGRCGQPRAVTAAGRELHSGGNQRCWKILLTLWPQRGPLETGVPALPDAEDSGEGRRFCVMPTKPCPAFGGQGAGREDRGWGGGREESEM